MHHEFTGVFERDDEWFIGYCLEVPGANGQGHTMEECRENLSQAIAFVLQVRREEGLRGIPSDATVETLVVETAAVEIAQAA